MERLYDSPRRQILEAKDKKGEEVECHFSRLFPIHHLNLQRPTLVSQLYSNTFFFKFIVIWKKKKTYKGNPSYQSNL